MLVAYLYEGVFTRLIFPHFRQSHEPPCSVLPIRNTSLLCGLYCTLVTSFDIFKFLQGPKNGKKNGILIPTCMNGHLKENAKLRNPPLKAPLSLTTMKYRTQSAEQRVSKTNVILPSSEPMAPVIDVGGLFDRLKLQYL